MFWIGLFLVLLVLVGRDRLLKPWTWFGGGKAMTTTVLSAQGW
jgi:branched-chain amino acid transport system permease protein